LLDPHSPVTPERINQLAWGYAATLILEAGIHHKIFDVLDSGPKSLDELVAATGASRRGVSAIANALIGFEFLVRDSHDRYANGPEASAFLVSTKPSFQGGVLRHTSRDLIPAWLHLNEAVATGKPAQTVDTKAGGEKFFNELVADIFPMGYPAGKVLAAHLNLAASGGPAKALDLAAGSGVWGIALAQSAPNLHVTAVDFPGVLPVTRDFTKRFGLVDRFSFVEGDILEADLGSGYQAATLGHILHSEGEARSRKLLKRVFAALAPGGTIAIAEFLVNADRTGPPSGLIFAVNMFVNTTEGDTYSFEEISEWLTEGGFVNARLLEAPGPSPLVLATKPA
jgi:SAM-dependent methyltransferase